MTLKKRCCGLLNNAPYRYAKLLPAGQIVAPCGFFYGSLSWNPTLEFDDACIATLVGWHRAFCLRLTVGRGTACRLGRMLALKEGGRTKGIAYRISEATLETELTLLWKREMIIGCYRPSWFSLILDDGRVVNALVFVIDQQHPFYEADTRIQVVAPLIAAASGPLGTNAQYLFLLEAAEGRQS